MTTETQPQFDASTSDRADEDVIVEQLARLPWWLFLVTGAAWVVFAFLVLSFDFRTVLGVAIFAGISFIVAGITELTAAAYVPSWKWARIALGVLCIAAGLVALLWPGITFVVLAALIGWFLMFQGAFNVVGALMDRRDLWWLRLIVGVLEVAIGFWAVGYPGRSFVLLAAWVAAAALLRGVGQMVTAFVLREAQAGGRAAGGAGATGTDRSFGPSARPSANGEGTPPERTEPGASTGGGAGPDDLRTRLIDEFHANHGAVGGPFEGTPLLLLHSTAAGATGAEGAERVSPLVYQRDGDRLVVFAAEGAAQASPDWYQHLIDNPRASVEVGDERYAVDAHPADQGERERLWGRQQQTTPYLVPDEPTSSAPAVRVIILERVA
ncbi:MAG: hypothetical protein JWN46_4016 [Acidimicrobiales bacterium]|nr:hypothetical protein [Acidimicrobiales bacterium]